jgi:hypothetical protein
MTDTIPAQTFDMAEFYARIEQSRRDAAEVTKTQRAGLRARLQALGVTQITARYDGYSDSGNSELSGLTPEGTELDDALTTSLEDLFWRVAYGLHPGFENNEGGDGEIDWDVETDVMNVEHRDRYIEFNTFTHEGV